MRLSVKNGVSSFRVSELDGSNIDMVSLSPVNVAYVERRGKKTKYEV